MVAAVRTPVWFEIARFLFPLDGFRIAVGYRVVVAFALKSGPLFLLTAFAVVIFGIRTVVITAVYHVRMKLLLF